MSSPDPVGTSPHVTLCSKTLAPILGTAVSCDHGREQGNAYLQGASNRHADYLPPIQVKAKGKIKGRRWQAGVACRYMQAYQASSDTGPGGPAVTEGQLYSHASRGGRAHPAAGQPRANRRATRLPATSSHAGAEPSRTRSTGEEGGALRLADAFTSSPGTPGHAGTALRHRTISPVYANWVSAGSAEVKRERDSQPRELDHTALRLTGSFHRTDSLLTAT